MRKVSGASWCYDVTAAMFMCLACVLALLTGCASRSGIQAPRDRVGALPFPGLFSLYAAVNPSRVAPHQYRAWTARPFESEGDRGIVFTQRAGFLDMAHVRLAMDWSWYIAQVIQSEADKASVNLKQGEMLQDFEVSIAYHDSTMQLRVKASEYSRQYAATLATAAAYRLLTWHEVATWYGYRTVPFVSERRSSFTVDDSMSHVVGIDLGHQLIHLTSDRATYDRLAGELLTQKLAELGAADEATTTRMCNAVEGTWWEGVEARLIDANAGLGSQHKRPLLPAANRLESFELGTPQAKADAALAGASPWYSIRVCGATANNVRRVLRRDCIESDEDFALLIDDVTRQMATARSGITIVTDESVARRVQAQRAVAVIGDSW